MSVRGFSASEFVEIAAPATVAERTHTCVRIRTARDRRRSPEVSSPGAIRGQAMIAAVMVSFNVDVTSLVTVAFAFWLALTR
jgi:hypothetical protein